MINNALLRIEIDIHGELIKQNEELLIIATDTVIRKHVEKLLNDSLKENDRR